MSSKFDPTKRIAEHFERIKKADEAKKKNDATDETVDNLDDLFLKTVEKGYNAYGRIHGVDAEVSLFDKKAPAKEREPVNDTEALSTKEILNRVRQTLQRQHFIQASQSYLEYIYKKMLGVKPSKNDFFYAIAVRELVSKRGLYIIDTSRNLAKELNVSIGTFYNVILPRLTERVGARVNTTRGNVGNITIDFSQTIEQS